MTPEVERQLLEYLKDQKAADVPATLRSLLVWTQDHTRDDAVRHEEIRGALRGHSLRIGALEKNDDRIDDRLEKSGSWQLEAERAKVITEAGKATFWKDKTLTIVVGIVMLLLGGSASLFFHH